MIAATVIIAREDLSIPGVLAATFSATTSSGEDEARFFTLVRHSQPDVILLDIRREPSRAADAIAKIRERCAVPIVVGCDRLDRGVDHYRRIGAADCIAMPFNIGILNTKLKQIAERTGSGSRLPPDPAQLPLWRV